MNYRSHYKRVSRSSPALACSESQKECVSWITEWERATFEISVRTRSFFASRTSKLMLLWSGISFSRP